eukprot:gene19880-biopygen22068
MHCAPGLAGGVRTQKVVIWPPKNRYSGPLAPQQGRIWHPGGTPRKSKIEILVVFDACWTAQEPPPGQRDVVG